MLHKSKVKIETPEDKNGIYLCPKCKQKTSQKVLTFVTAYNEVVEDALIQFYDGYYIIQCNGCSTISFSRTSRCSEDVCYDNNGFPTLAQHEYSYPEIETTKFEKTEYFIESSRLSALKALPKRTHDTSKLIQMLFELNSAYTNQSYFSCIFLVRAIIDHVPPIFGLSKFTEVSNNYNGGGKSFRSAMLHLQNSSRKIADTHLHSTIRPTESTPNKTQVEFRADLDVLLAEVLRILQKKS